MMSLTPTAAAELWIWVDEGQTGIGTSRTVGITPDMNTLEAWTWCKGGGTIEVSDCLDDVGALTVVKTSTMVNGNYQAEYAVKFSGSLGLLACSFGVTDQGQGHSVQAQGEITFMGDTVPCEAASGYVYLNGLTFYDISIGGTGTNALGTEISGGGGGIGIGF